MRNAAEANNTQRDKVKREHKDGLEDDGPVAEPVLAFCLKVKCNAAL